MRTSLILLMALVIYAPITALACSPSFDYINRPLAVKLQGDDFFIGKVINITSEKFIFEVITSGGPAIDKKPGDEISFERKTYGTCGELNIQKGDIWLYNGNNISFSHSVKLQYSDTKDGYDLESVKKKIVARLDPDYVPAHIPEKSDLPVIGLYSQQSDCTDSDKARGIYQSSYILKINAPDAQTGKYAVKITIKNCNDGKSCSFQGSAPAYGYGQLIIPFDTAENQYPKDCSLIIKQISAANEWPKLQKGQSSVIMNNSHCKPVLDDCSSLVSFESPILQKN